ncbi:DNA alkylation repair protein [Candidatus Falkowbacteria bacterium CG10_big_fil_rev_8_21_14_0_10_37_14]|uniref:DNA alkylation repair protein n=1 Tax=Candidatus Falkowbacteria bacterium CG10_big_fil_rev_8_21_14_0_10_37_14 TaxID=1974561 RepID=A0A2M6WT72_9BACT|nr:DNA alkylation repair protein [Candidatus Falkowbacteria bacterium]PIT95978.1 MAG: DNA alkylation repair protein [Candidatus Falkowbacteria bacterium CG10_big_fil_rev_8_21_14_0_10_37_14]
MLTHKSVQTALKSNIKPGKAEIFSRFFKTGPGQYGAGDKFLGVMVPEQRQIAKQFIDLPLVEIEKLLNSTWHEERLTAVLILVYQYQQADEKKQKRIFNFYLAHTSRINNWDLVDVSADKIIGAYLFTHPDQKLLDKLVISSNLWERRIAVLASFYFIKNQQFDLTLQLAKKLLTDQHDLMHKAVGWMLREIGKRDEAVLIKFLEANLKKMPRTMLRYSLERLGEADRRRFMAK